MAVPMWHVDPGRGWCWAARRSDHSQAHGPMFKAVMLAAWTEQGPSVTPPQGCGQGNGLGRSPGGGHSHVCPE